MWFISNWWERNDDDDDAKYAANEYALGTGPSGHKSAAADDDDGTNDDAPKQQFTRRNEPVFPPFYDTNELHPYVPNEQCPCTATSGVSTVSADPAADFAAGATTVSAAI